MKHFDLARPTGLFEEFDRAFFNTPSVFKSMDHDFVQAVELNDEEKHYLVSLDIPGVKRDEVQVEVNENVLCISGERKNEFEKDGYSEKSYGKFSRSFKLPKNANLSELEASHEDGVLHVVIPKTDKSESPKKIEVKEGKGSFLKKLLN